MGNKLFNQKNESKQQSDNNQYSTEKNKFKIDLSHKNIENSKNSGNEKQTIVKYLLKYLNVENKILNKQKFYAYGDNDYGNVTHLNNCEFNEVFIGNFQCFAYDDVNDCYISWGLNNFGQLGQKTVTNYLQHTDKEYFHDTLGKMDEIFYLDNGINSKVKFKLMAFGDGFTVGVDTTNSIYSWGLNENCQLGIELKYDECEIISGKKVKLEPIKIGKLELEIVKLSCGRDFTLILDVGRNVWAWGDNSYQQIAPYESCKRYRFSTITNIDELTSLTLVDIKAGWSHGCGIAFLGLKAYIWGKIEESLVFDSIKQLNIENELITSVESGFSHVCFLTNKNNVYAIGDNTYVSF